MGTLTIYTDAIEARAAAETYSERTGVAHRVVDYLAGPLTAASAALVGDEFAAAEQFFLVLTDAEIEGMAKAGQVDA